jgi:carbamoyl-phosphate synthase large subunit
MFAAYLEHAHHEEFTVDAYYDRHSELKCVVPRLRLEVRGGEVVKGRAIKNDLVGFLFSRLAKIPGARGCLTFQFFRHRDTEDVWLIELNPRFGGGYPLTAAAGAPYHDWLVREYLEDETIAKLVNWQDGKTMLRFDDAVFLDG